MAATDAVHILQGVDPAVIPMFKASAENILKQYSPEEALARALAGATGYTKLPPPRSLFGRKDFQTLLVTTKRKGGYITKSTARNFLSDALGKNMPMNVYITSCVDGRGCIHAASHMLQSLMWWLICRRQWSHCCRLLKNPKWIGNSFVNFLNFKTKMLQ